MTLTLSPLLYLWVFIAELWLEVWLLMALEWCWWVPPTPVLIPSRDLCRMFDGTLGLWMKGEGVELISRSQLYLKWINYKVIHLSHITSHFPHWKFQTDLSLLLLKSGFNFWPELCNAHSCVHFLSYKVYLTVLSDILCTVRVSKWNNGHAVAFHSEF